MLAIRLATQLLVSGLSALAAGIKDDRTVHSPLKQTTRNEVVMRASRTRARRATVSGSIIPNSVNQATFVMTAVNTGDPTVDGLYPAAYDPALSSSDNKIWMMFSATSPAGAELYYLDSNSYLIRGDGQYACVSSTGTSAIVFDTPNSQISATSGNSIFVTCGVSSAGALSCVRASAPNTPTRLVVCGGSTKRLLMWPVDTSTTCAVGAILAKAAVP